MAGSPIRTARKNAKYLAINIKKFIKSHYTHTGHQGALGCHSELPGAVQDILNFWEKYYDMWYLLHPMWTTSSQFNIRQCYIPFDNALSLQRWVFLVSVKKTKNKKMFCTRIIAEHETSVAISKLTARFEMFRCKYPISK